LAWKTGKYLTSQSSANADREPAMPSTNPSATLERLLKLPSETTWVEFKLNRVDAEELGKYLAGVSNAAALEGEPYGYVIYGIEDRTHIVRGTSFVPESAKAKGNEDLEPWLTRLLSPRLPFRIFKIPVNGLMVVMFEIQAMKYAPVSFMRQRFIRIGSHLKPLYEHMELERQLWAMASPSKKDWSAEICSQAHIGDLSPEAIAAARERFKQKNPALAKEVDDWDAATFLNKLKLCINGSVTRAAIVLLGRDEAEHFLAPAVCRLTWVVMDDDGNHLDYAHYGPPFLLAVERVFERIRNLTYRYLPSTGLFPQEVTQYDPWVIRESLHNCIAHQDYEMCAKISVVERPGSLAFRNAGLFLPGSVEEHLARNAPPHFYRNRLLADAMVSINMIDTVGSGILRMFVRQRERYFPLPEYDLSDSAHVAVTISGQVMDERYTRMLMARSDLKLDEVIALDKVQKGKALTEDEFTSLKRQELIEGRRPHLRVAAKVAVATDTVVDYLKKRGVDKQYCEKMVIELLRTQQSATRRDIDKLLIGKISDLLGPAQKRSFVSNLLQELRRDGKLAVSGKGPGARWELCSPRDSEPD
jgi:ATP-dependent DNA helicase RecG